MKLVDKVCWVRLLGEVGGTGGRVAGALVTLYLLKKYSHRSCSSSSTYCTHAREIGMEYQRVSAVAVGYRWRWQG